MSTPPSRFSRNPVPERINQTLSSQPARHATGSFKAQGIGEESAFSTTQKVSIEPSSVQKKPMNRPSNGLEIRLDRLIDVVADFKGFKKEETDRDKIKALTHPSLITEKYEQIYQQQVLPARNKVFQNIEESQKAHPDHIIFMHSKEGHSKLVSLSRERAGSNAAYEGCDVEVISSGRSPFQPPSILFATPQAEQVVIDDAAFESSEPERSHPPKL